MPEQMVERYRKVLDRIRDTGGALAPWEERPPLRVAPGAMDFLAGKPR
jgi:hypothetical protein